MATLVIDASLVGILLGVADQGGKILQYGWYERGQEAASRLPSLCAQVLADAGVQMSELERLVLGHGPGSFTGIKIGLAFGLGMARARPELKVFGISAFHSYFKSILRSSEVAILPCTANSSYFLLREGAGYTHGLIQVAQDLTMEERSMDGSILGLVNPDRFIAVHTLGDCKLVSSYLSKAMQHLTWNVHSMEEDGRNLLESMIRIATESSESVSSMEPFYLEKSAPEEKYAKV